MPTIIDEELRSAGMTDDKISRSSSELDAVDEALRWARAGDLLLLPVHEHRRVVLDLLSTLSERGWQPGEPVAGWTVPP